MQKRISILIGVLLLVINFSFASVNISKDIYQKRIDNILNKAEKYTTISATEKAEYKKSVNEFFNGLEKCLNKSELYDSQKMVIVNTIDMIWKGLEITLTDPNIPVEMKAAFIKKELKEKQLLYLNCSDLPVGNKGYDKTLVSSGNYTPIQKTKTCSVGQKLEGMCVYALPSYGVSLETAKRNCGNYGMTFATKEQTKVLSEHSDIIYKGYSGEAGSIFVDGYVSGYNLSGSYYTVLCVK